MQFRTATWNVNNRKFKSTHAALVKGVDTDLLALQEVSDHFYAGLQDAALFKWSHFSLALRPPERTEGRSRRLGCAVFGREPFRVAAATLLDNVAFPERTLVVQIDSPLKLNFCSFHTPPGASWGKVKPQTLRAIAEWLNQQNGYTVFGIDANTPKTDHPEIEQNEWWWKDEPTLLGHAPLHNLRDALRLYFADRPEALQEITTRKPRGPLAVSHIRGNRRKMTECRYDFIYVSPSIRVLDVRYLHEESLQAGSDHALVTAHLEVPEAAV